MLFILLLAQTWAQTTVELKSYRCLTTLQIERDYVTFEKHYYFTDLFRPTPTPFDIAHRFECHQGPRYRDDLSHPRRFEETAFRVYADAPSMTALDAPPGPFDVNAPVSGYYESASTLGCREGTEGIYAVVRLNDRRDCQTMDVLYLSEKHLQRVWFYYQNGTAVYPRSPTEALRRQMHIHHLDQLYTVTDTASWQGCATGIKKKAPSADRKIGCIPLD